MAYLDIYRRETDGSFTWIAGACSVKTARAIIKSAAASSPTEEYLIYDNASGEKLTLRANGCWLTSKEPAKASDGSALPFSLHSAQHFR
jgi:hypothetical protein